MPKTVTICSTPGCTMPVYAPDIYGDRCGYCNPGVHEVGSRKHRLDAILPAIAAADEPPRPRRRALATNSEAATKAKARQNR